MNLHLSAFSLGIREELEKESMLQKEAASSFPAITPAKPAAPKPSFPKPALGNAPKPITPATQPSLLQPTGRDLDSLDTFKDFKARQAAQQAQAAQPVAPRPTPQMFQRQDMYERMQAEPGNFTPIDPRGAETLRSGLLSGALTPKQVQNAIRLMPAHQRTQAQMIVAGGRDPQQVLAASQNYNNPMGGNTYGQDYIVHQNNQNWINAQRAITSANPLIGKAGTKENDEFLKQYRALAGNNLNQNHQALQGALAAVNTPRPAAASVAQAPAVQPGQPVQANPNTQTHSSQGTAPVPVSTNDTTRAGAPLPGGPIESARPVKTSMDLSSMPMNENILPNISKQSKWKYVRTKDGLKLTDGNLVYSFGGFPESFSADDSRVSRLNDDNILDLEKDMKSKGTAQIHRSSPDNIYMTLADGSQNPTFMLQHEEGKNWRYSPSKKFLAKLKAISDITKKENPDLPEVVNVNPESMMDAASDAGVKLANLSMNMTAEDLANAGTGLVEGVKNFGKGFVETHAKKPVTGFLESYLLSKGIGSVRDYLNPRRKIERLINPSVRTSREVWPLAEAALATLGSRAIAM